MAVFMKFGAKTGDVDTTHALRCLEIAQRGNPTVFDNHVGAVGASAASVDDQATRQRCIQHTDYDICPRGRLRRSDHRRLLGARCC